MTQSAECTNILLSFLHDVGEDYTDNFIFPLDSLDEFAAPSNQEDDLCIDDFLVDTDAPLETPVSGKAVMIGTDTVACSSSGNIMSSPSLDEEEFQQTLGFLDFGNIDCFNAEDIFESSGTVQVDGFLSSLAIEQEKREPTKVSKKRSRSTANDENLHIDNPELSTYKKSRASLNHTISHVCGMLKQYRAQKMTEETAAKKAATKQFRCSEPVALATKYLQAMFNNKPVSPQDLLKISSAGSTFECKALSSMVEMSQSKRAMAKLSAWMPAVSATNKQAYQFPSTHTGIGQIAAASRAFNASMNDMLTPSLVSKLGFDVNIPTSSAITSKNGDRLSSAFTWSTKGLVAMGYPKELEFHGLIRASFGCEGVTSCNVEFDACKVMREKQEHDIFIEEVSPRTVTSAMVC